jgi:hypothetical protein
MVGVVRYIFTYILTVKDYYMLRVRAEYAKSVLLVISIIAAFPCSLIVYLATHELLIALESYSSQSTQDTELYNHGHSNNDGYRGRLDKACRNQQ